MILYVGNALSRHGFTPSVMEFLVPRLAARVNIISRSQRRNQWARLLDMSWTILANRRTLNLVFIDAYSTKAFWYLVITAWLCRRFAIPYVPVLHGGNLPQRIKESQYFSDTVFRNSVINICPSNYLAILCDQNRYRSFYIPNFLEMKNYPYKQRSRPSCRLLWVRAFHRIYNPELAVRVLARLRETYPDAELCMVGPDKDGSLPGIKSLASELGLGDAIRFTGRMAKEEWISLSSGFDIFLNTTDFDNMPVSVMEAMALGMPVVSTNVGGIKFLITDETDGLLVDKGDLEGFVHHINSLMTQEGLAVRITQAARKKAQSFAWENVEPLWLDIINRFQKQKR